MELQGGYIRSFETVEEFNEERNNNYYEPWVSYTNEVSAVTYNKTEEEKLRTPLTFEIISDGNIKWIAPRSSFTRTIEYRKNDGEWTSITSSIYGTNISVVSGDTVQFKGDNATYGSGNVFGDVTLWTHFVDDSCFYKVKGNIMSLINSTGFSTATTLTSDYTFPGLFSYCSGLTDASELLLPATTLTKSCYDTMFVDCTSLTTAPELPAKTMTPGCYTGMFLRCTSLTTAPELPATTMASSACSAMFWGCTSLTTAPELPATTLADYCYSGMFSYCTSLTQAPELPATTLAEGCYIEMFNYCTSLTEAPELPATTLANYCYSNMFEGCSNLNYIKCLATNISASYCTTYWVNGVASNGTFVKNPSMSSWTTGSNGIPANWTVQDAQ